MQSLTDLARQALQAEVCRRGVAYKLAPDATLRTEKNASRIPMDRDAKTVAADSVTALNALGV